MCGAGALEGKLLCDDAVVRLSRLLWQHGCSRAVMRVRLRSTDDEWRVVDDDGQAWVTFAGSPARMFALHDVLQLTAQFDSRTGNSESSHPHESDSGRDKAH
jgi:hypothetical protein